MQTASVKLGLLCPNAHVAMPDTQSKYVLPFSSVNVDPDPETNVIGYLPYVFCTRLSNSCDVEDVSSFDGGVKFVVIVPGGEIVECSCVVEEEDDIDDGVVEEKALALHERANIVASTEDC